MKRRILTFMLCICMFFQLMPAVGTVYAAGGYNPKRNDDFVIPAALRSNRDFMMGSSLRGSQANFINKMGLNGNSTYKDFETDKIANLSEVSRELQSAGQLDYTIGARLKASHNDLNGAEIETVLKFNGYYYYPQWHTAGFKDHGIYENADFKRAMSWNYFRLQATTTNEAWYTKATQTKDLAIYLLDEKAPTVESCEITQNDEKASAIQLGSTIRFTLNFSEYIRFADDSASHEPGLEFEILPYGEIVSDPIRLKADFVELYDNKMVFEYTFLDEYSGYEGIKEFYISRIEKITQQEDLDAKYDLALLPKEIADAAKTPTVTVNNLITDLAGNAVEEVLATDESGAVTGEREIVFNSVKIDSKAPSVQNVGIEKKLMWNITDEDAGLYAKVGDRVQLSVSFAEPVSASAGSTTLTLNIQDSAGQPVTVKNDTDISGGTVMTFEEVEITEGMTYTGDADAEGKITPVSIDGSAVLDSAKNPCGVHNLKEEGIFANQDFALDTLGPAINLITPITNFDDDAIFCVPLNIADEDGNGDVAASDIDTMRGYFYLTGFPSSYYYVTGGNEAYYEKQYFSYYISNTVMTEAELEDRWISATEQFRTDLPDASAYYFDLYSGGDTYIYIKIGDIEITNPTIHVMAEDVAGNRNIVSEQVDYTLDMTNPTFGNVSRVNITPNQNTPNTYDLSCSITLEDENGINLDTFRASADNGLFTDAGLGSHEYIDLINTAGEDGKTNTITFVMKAVAAGEIPKYNVTFTVEDIFGNESQVTFPFTYNLTSFHIVERATTENENGYAPYIVFHRVVEEFTQNAKTILMIKDPYSNENGYAAAIVDQYYIAADQQNMLTDERVQWSYYTRSENADSQKQILLTPAEGSVDFIRDLTTTGGYFGDVSYVLISGDGLTIEDFTTNDPLPVTVPISITEDTIRMGGLSDAVQGVLLAPGFDFEPVDWELDPTGGVWQMPEYGEEGLTTYNTSLAGKSIRVRLSLPEINGLAWSDYERVILKLGYATEDNVADNDNPIFETPLSLTEEEQYIVLPESLNEAFFTERTNLEFYIQTFAKWDSVYSYGLYTTSGEIFSCYNNAQLDEAYLQKLTKNTYIEVPDNNGGTERVSVLHEQEFGSAQETAQDLGVAKAIDIAPSDMTTITLDFAGLGYEQRIRIWNETNGETKEGAEWLMSVPNFERHLVENALNTVYYQTVNPYSGLSDIHTLIFDTRQEAPKLSVGFTPSADDGYATERRLVITELSGGAGEELTVKMIDPDGNIVDFPEGDDAIVRDEKYRAFYTVNSAGAIGYTAVKAEKIDAESPVITIDSQGGDYLGISVMDDVFEEDLSDMELYLRYDDPAYRAILEEYGLLTDEDGFFKVEEFSQSAFGTHPENTAMGILEYTGSLRPLDGQINAGMAFTAPARSGGYTGTISMYVVDRVGHQSDIVTAAMNIPEIKFTENEFFYSRDNYPFGPEENIVSPYYSVSLENPAEVTEPKLTDRGIRGEIDTEDVFRDLYEAMPVYKDGEYTLTVKDHFGDEHEVAYTVPPEAFDGDRLDVYAVNAKDGDKDIVNVSIKSLDGSSFKVELPSDDDYDMEAMGGYVIDPSMKAGEATVWQDDGSAGAFGEFYTDVTLKVTKNGTFKVLVENNEGLLTEYLVNVYINKEVAELETMWSFPNGLFEDEDGQAYTYDYATFVVDTVDPERTLVGESAFNFTYNDPVGTTKTFTVTDDYGFVQECTATLDFEIRKSEQEYLLPPDMEVSIYAERNNTSVMIGSIGEEESERYGELIDMYGGATQYRLTASTLSPNNVKTVLLPYGEDTSGITYDTAQNAAIDGVEVVGDVIYINSEDAEFSLVMVDEKDLLSERFDFDGGFTIDITPPVISDVKKTVKGYSIELEITVTDDVSSFDELTVLSPGGVTRGENTFLYTVGQNGSVVFTVSDKCGNFTTQAISIAEIDDTKPVARLVAYSPSSETSKVVLPAIANRDIEAFITFNKNIIELSLEILKDGTYIPVTDGDGVSISKNTESSATVTFTKGASVRVQYKSLNGQSGTPLEINIPDSIIDKSTPNIVTEVIYNKRDGASKPISATIRAYAENKTIFYGRGTYTKENPFEETVYENNIYEYFFTDSAGNVAEVNIDVNEIDEKRLEVYAYEIPEQITPSGAEFKLSVNKPATVTLDDGLTTSDSLTVTEPNGAVLTLAAQSAGFYTITATDESGNIVNCFVSIAVGDSLPPVIMADTDYVYVRQGSDIASIDDSMLTSGLFVSDDKSGAENITLTVDRSGLPADLSTIGNYAYTVTAADEAGNTADIRRYLSVYAKNAIAVEIDGIFTKHTGVATTSKGEHTISVSLPNDSVLGTAFEPYQVYCTKGFYTLGQMKPWMLPMTASSIKDGVNDEYRYNFEQEGWYTVYVLRQNREAFLVHVLIQE